MSSKQLPPMSSNDNSLVSGDYRVRAMVAALPKFLGNHVAIVDYPSFDILYLNPAAKDLFELDDSTGKLNWLDFVNFTKDLDYVKNGIEECIISGNWRGEVELKKSNQESFPFKLLASCPPGSVIETGVISILGRDISDAKKQEAEHEKLTLQLNLMGKMDALGRLSAGVAHEINTPSQYILNNLSYLQQNLPYLLQCMNVVKDQLTTENEANRNNNELSITAEVLDELVDDIPDAITQSIQGIETITQLVTALKEFSHPEHKDKHLNNLNDSIKNALIISRHEWINIAEIKLELDPKLPKIEFVADEINQALLILLINACSAINKAKEINPRCNGEILIRSYSDEKRVYLSIYNNGFDINEANAQSLTQESNSADKNNIDQSLNIVNKVIKDNHHGELLFQTGGNPLDEANNKISKKEGTSVILSLPRS